MVQPDNQILVADDETELLSEGAGYLRRPRHSVISASSYSEALRAYTDNADYIGLVLTDIMMPDGNGLDLARLVIDHSNGTCPCLLMSGDFNLEGLESDLTLAGVRSIAKPFSFSNLYASVSGALATTA
jgi:DNA-binding NtrC family response regulator